MTKQERERVARIDKEIAKFLRQCVREEYTDTGAAWELLHWIRGEARKLSEKSK